MDKILLDQYKKRVSSASPLELTNISFELFEHYTNEAINADRNSAEFIKNATKARDFIIMLNDTLDKNYEISENLTQIYQYIIKILNDGIENKEPIFLKDALRVLSPLESAFKDIENDGYGQLNKNNFDTNVFAGLTYGKSGINEFVDESNGGQSFSG